MMRIAILLAPDLGVTLPLLEGLRTSLANHPHAELLPLAQEQEATLHALVARRQVDAVIAPYMSDRAIDPTVPIRRLNVSTISNIRTIPSIIPDDRAIGRVAKEHFATMGYATTVCLSNPAHYGARLRAEAFEATLPTPTNLLDPRNTQGLKDWLLSLPEGTGIFCTSDQLACRITQAATSIGRPIPDSLAIVGVGNDPAASLISPKPLTTIPLPYEQIGKLAASYILGRQTTLPAPLPPLPLIMRETTGWQHPSTPSTSRALSYILRHLHTPPDVARLARHAKLSRRTLEYHFRATFNASPAAIWRKYQLRQATQLLRTTTLPLEGIARQTGFAGASHLVAVFKRAGLGTPGSHRDDR